MTEEERRPLARDAAGLRWLNGVRIFIAGGMLGGLQILLLLASGFFGPGFWGIMLPLHLSWDVILLLSAVSYLLYSFIEAFVASSQQRKASFGGSAAWWIVGISVLIAELPVLSFIATLLFAPHVNNGSVRAGLSPLVAVVLFAMALAIGLWGWMWSAIGGLIGGAVAH